MRKVADRDRSEYEQIRDRMQARLEQRRFEIDPQKRREIDLEYLDLVAKKLAFESAFLGLIQVYLGNYGAPHSDGRLALNYMRLGADYGFHSSQRILGVVTAFGLLGVPKNEFAGMTLLNEAAVQGDRPAQRLLASVQLLRGVMLRKRNDTAFPNQMFSESRNAGHL